MEHGGKADDRGRFFDHAAHCGLSVISVSDDLGERPVVADGAGKDERNVIFDTAVHDSVINLVVVNKLCDGTAFSYAVDDVKMIVMSVGLGFLCIDILSEGSVEHSAFQIVGRKCVSGHQTIYIAVFNHGLHGASCIRVKRERRSHDPYDISVVFLVF